MSDNFLHDELDFCDKADKIIIGISGGADSVALTHILFSHLPVHKLICAHVNHGIRGDEAKRDQEFVASFCSKLGIKLELLQADIPALAKEWRMGEEECGRKVRYDFFSRLAGENGLIVTAHNADDNAETILMNLTKGSGLKGLTGIPRLRGNVYRPILSMTRQEIEVYCQENGLDFVTDSTNMCDDYDRNRLRHNVMPVLKELNSGFVKSAERMAELLSEDNDYLESQAKALLDSAHLKAGFQADILSSAPLPVLRRAVKLYLESSGAGRLEKKHIDLAIKAIKSGSSVNIPGALLVDVKQNCVTVTEAAKAEDFTLPLSEGNNLLPGGKVITIERFGTEFKKNSEKINNLLFNNYADYDKIVSGLVATRRREGDRFSLQGRGITKTLKKLFNELKIPAALRSEVVVVRDSDAVVYIEGIGVDNKYKVNNDTVRAVRFSVSPEIDSNERNG